MIIPSIDLMNGSAVQLVGGKELKIDAGDPRPIAREFALAGEIAVVDLDAALRQGNNTEVILELMKLARCRVGGGIRDVESALRWLDLGADRIVLGTAAQPEVLRELPAERVIAALDAVDGEVVVDGWRTKTGANIADRMKEIAPFVSGFLVTFVEKEGRMAGTDMGRVQGLIDAAEGRELTIAGGVTTVEEIAELDRLGVHAQVGMALYSKAMSLAEAICAPLTSDRPDGLWPTIICDERGVALGLAYSSLESVKKAVELQAGVYQSRKRGLWVKGATSGDTQTLIEITPDCDRDTLRFTVRQNGSGFCHLETDTCFGNSSGHSALLKTLSARKLDAPEGSYTHRLWNDAKLLEAKLVEEASELAQAEDPEHVAQEAADLLYFLSVAMTRANVSMEDVDRVLDQRAKNVSRRPGNAKT